MVSNAVASTSVTLDTNPLYNSGPPLSGSFNQLIFKMLPDVNTIISSIKANPNDNYIFQYTNIQTSEEISEIPDSPGIIIYDSTVLERLNLRIGSYFRNNEPYTGPFAASTDPVADKKAEDLRKAFLLAYPREQIINELIKPFDSTATVPQSFILNANNNELVADNNSSQFISPTRVQDATNLIKSYYPDSYYNSDTDYKTAFDVNMLWKQSNRRKDQFAIIKSELRKVGINLLNDSGTDDMFNSSNDSSLYMNNNIYDAAFFALSIVNYNYLKQYYKSDIEGNNIGLNDPNIDSELDKLLIAQSDAEILSIIQNIEIIINNTYVVLPLFWWKICLVYNNKIKNIKSFSNIIDIWNYWEWKL